MAQSKGDIRGRELLLLRESKICENRGKKFFRTYDNDKQWAERRFCSHQCHGKAEGFSKGHEPWNKGLKGIHLNPLTEFKKGHVPANKGKPHPYGHKIKKGEHISPRTEIKKGQHLSPKTELTSEGAKSFWRDSEMRDEILRRQAISRRSKRPSKPEKRFMEINQKYKLGFIYVVNEGIVVGGFRPDFMHETKKIIVEILGDYWHTLPKVQERDKRKFDAYRKLGWKVIFLWASELDDEEKVIRWFV